MVGRTLNGEHVCQDAVVDIAGDRAICVLKRQRIVPVAARSGQDHDHAGLRIDPIATKLLAPREAYLSDARVQNRPEIPIIGVAALEPPIAHDETMRRDADRLRLV